MDTSFERQEKSKTKDEWMTPPRIIASLGEFDLDPCSPIKRNWDTAKRHYSLIEDGLKSKWDGRIWLNPPYGSQTQRWLSKLAYHGNGIALVFARTDNKWFHEIIIPKADAILFTKGRITFLHADGTLANNSGGSGSLFVAFGEENAKILSKSGIRGTFINLRNHSN